MSLSTVVSRRFLLGSAVVLLALVGPGDPRSAAAAKRTTRGLAESSRWLQGYLRIDTTNPPGNEGAAADYLARILAGEGIPTRRWVSSKGRINLMARLGAGTGSGPSLILLHHMDVVAPGPGWTVPPFSAMVQDGRMWARGAVDDKSLGIAQLVAVVRLHRARKALARSVLLVAVADEENGGDEGTGWLVAHQPDFLAGAEALLGEGGLNLVSSGQLRWWGIEVAQKRPLWLEVTATGRGGHGSGLNPSSANHQLIAALDRLLQRPEKWRVTAPARAYLQALVPLQNPHWQQVFTHIDQLIDEKKGPLTFMLPGMANLFLDTVQVTVLKGGERINVIPERAVARLDIRLLPDTDANAFLAEVRRALGPDVDVKVLQTAPPAPTSPAAGTLWRALVATLKKDGPVVPAVIAGFTDSRYARVRGVPSYGVSPFALAGEDLRGIHGTDERIPIEEFERGVERLTEVVSAYALTPRP
jgi:acetylornithine deacetylase/succinyl-diaminopimelate desuccinylase-like protein